MLTAPRLDFDALDKRERAKRAVRAFHDQAVLDRFRFHGLSLAEMDRAELLGVISFLASSSHLMTVKVPSED